MHLVIGGSPLLKKSLCVCQTIIACKTCSRDLKADCGTPTGKNTYDKKDHVCYTSKCSCCGSQANLLYHKCYVYPVDTENEALNKKRDVMRGVYGAFDFETVNIWPECRTRLSRFRTKSRLLSLGMESGGKLVQHACSKLLCTDRSTMQNLMAELYKKTKDNFKNFKNMFQMK